MEPDGANHETEPRLIVEPVAGPSLLAVLATLKPLAEELPRIARPVAEPVEM